ncbi:MAG: B12-binding domain-containing radical SAM protein [Acidobacteriota bacterium]|nr:B12-binding domain-containing radical SAM protein [Acidobacteriota bacterium]
MNRGPPPRGGAVAGYYSHAGETIMRVCLISPPTVTQFTERQVIESEALRLISEHAPLGILSLAGVLVRQGVVPDVLDLNRLYYEYVKPDLHRQNHADFASYVIRHLEATEFDVFGFSTICSTYPLTLRLAQGVRLTHPEATIILGGPQASVVDVPTLHAFPFVDFVVRGEAEETLPLLLDAVGGGGGVAHIGGLTYRAGSEVKRSPNAPVIADLDRLPMPAYDLYPYIKDCRYAPLEAGRGCPFACSFCSTNDFFRRRFRMKSPEVLVGQMKLMKERYGIDTFDLVHDMFTVDRKKVTAFCDAVEASGEKLYWNCSARTDCIDSELISRMARAGCIGLFFGIDTGSERMQQIIHKGLSLPEAARRVACTTRHGIKTMVSLIAGFHEETKEDLRATVRFLGESLRHKHADVQLHLLAPLAETPITTQFKEQLIYDGIFSDISPPGWEQEPEDRELIISHRDIFPNFYAVPTLGLDRRYLMELREFLLRGATKYRWLMLMLHRDAGDLLRIFDEWTGWLDRRGGGVAGARNRDYYAGEPFRRDLLSFTREHYIPALARHPHLVSTMADVEADLFRFHDGQSDARPARRRPGRRVTCGVNAVPVIAGDSRIIEVEADYKCLIRSLRRNERLECVPTGRFALLLVKSGIEIKVMQLNPTAHQLLRSCDGLRSVMQVASSFSREETINGIPAVKVGLHGLASLLQRRLIEIKVASPSPSASALPSGKPDAGRMRDVLNRTGEGDLP